MRVWMVAGVAAAAAGAFASIGCGGSEAPATAPTTGVDGRVIAGPTCPVVTPDCPPAKPVETTVLVETAPDTRASGSGELVKSIPSDANGRFATDLAPGDYVLTTEPSGSGYPLPKSVTVHVEPDAVSHVTLALDTGIR